MCLPSFSIYWNIQGLEYNLQFIIFLQVSSCHFISIFINDVNLYASVHLNQIEKYFTEGLLDTYSTQIIEVQYELWYRRKQISLLWVIKLNPHDLPSSVQCTTVYIDLKIKLSSLSLLYLKIIWYRLHDYFRYLKS